MTLSMNRRGVLLSAIATSWAAPVLVSAQGNSLSWTPRAVSADEARTLAAACERILPATGTPGAGAFGVPQYVDRQIATWCEPDDAQRLKAGLAALDTEAKAKFGVAFAAATAGQQDSLLNEAAAKARDAQSRKEPHYFPQLRELATTGYFTSQQGTTQVLRYDPVPGAYRPCVPLKEIGRAWATN
jgi:gluconate 2-dehydrogenase gamma chain